MDPIPTKIVPDCLDVLLPVLVNIIKSTLHSAIVPKPLKTAVMTPLPKNNGLDPNLCKNYHPVLNLPCASKLLECAVAEQLIPSTPAWP